MDVLLIIDDEETCRTVLADAARRFGWVAHVADSAESGLLMARMHKPSLVLFDLFMHGTGGLHLCSEMADDEELAKVPIIVMSGREHAHSRSNATSAGARDFIRKPMSIGGFRSLLSRWGTVKSDAGLPLNDDAMLPCGDVIVRFWGVRGSVPTPGRGTVRYGGNTSCVELRADGQIIALDAGSGIRQLGLLLLKEFGDDPVDVSILLTHHHWDHIQGFPFFLPAYAPRHRIKIVGYANERFGLEETMKGQMANPYFPISLTHMPAKLTFQEVTEAEFSIGGVRVESFETNHPGVCKGYKLHTSAGTICYIPDHEFIPGESSFEDGRLSERNMMAQFIRDAELVIMDAQYTEKEYLTRVGWGHSSVNEVVRCACDANVKRLVLFHHDPSHDDEFLDAMLQSARILATYSTLRIDSAKEGDCIRLVRQCKLPV